MLPRGSVKQAKIDDADHSVTYGPQTNSWSLTNGTSYFNKTLQCVSLLYVVYHTIDLYQLFHDERCLCYALIHRKCRGCLWYR